MNQMTAANETKKQGRMMQWITAVCKKWLSGICTTQMGLSPKEAQTFLNYGSYNWEAAMIDQWHMHTNSTNEVSS
ncbi:MAG: hypothetical protein IAF02_05065 [Anaerolineae bacterium]|nr:hypothetical protein [Anaerolineae bacterium]